MVYDDEDDEDDISVTRNLHSGWSTNSVQAGDIHCDVNFHASAAGSEREYFAALPWGFTVAIYAVLFVVVCGYAFAIGSLDMSFWDWVKLVLSSLLLVPVFVATDFRVHGDDFLALRVLGTLVIIGLAIGEGAKVLAIKDLVALVGHWLIWQF